MGAEGKPSGRFKIRHAGFLAFSFLVLALILHGIARLREKPGLPFSWAEEGLHLVVSRIDAAGAGIHSSDVILKVGGFPVRRSRDVEFALDGMRSGDVVTVAIRRAGMETDLPVVTDRWYTRTFIVINFILTFPIWLIGNFVLFRKFDEKPARMLYFLAQCLSLSIGIGAAYLPAGQGSFHFLLPVCYYLVYPVFPALLLNFTFIFPKEKRWITPRMLQTVLPYVPAAVFIPLLLVSHQKAMVTHRIENYERYFRVFTCHRVYLLVFFALSIITLFHSYFTGWCKSDKNKIRWIFWGMAVGSMPFMLFWTLPQILGYPPLLPEELVNLVLLVVPFSFAIAIVKYQAFDIDVLIRGSLVYFILTGLIAGLYLFLVGLIGDVLLENNPRINHFVIVGFTLVAAILFDPVKQKLQTFVDKTFYRKKYDYKQATQTFGLNMASASSASRVFELLIENVEQTLQVKQAAILRFSGGHLVPDQTRGFSVEEKSFLCFEGDGEPIGELRVQRLPVVRRGRVDSGDVVFFPENPTLDRSGIEVLMPFGNASETVGCLALGRKLSGLRYSEDDLDLLSALLVEASMTLERIGFQESAIQERTKSERFEKLNQLKSDFISHVSHELRTPLTSILASVHNLIDGIPEQPAPATAEVLERIRGSSHYLNRMICNLLDVTRIEADRLDLRSQRVSLEGMVQKTVQVMDPIAAEKGIKIQAERLGAFDVQADPDALQQILFNLVENAIKYSPKNRFVFIRAVRREGGSDSMDAGRKRIEISVRDEGDGLPEGKKEAIFNRFERVSKPGQSRKKGLGLGLYISRKLVEAMGGHIRAENHPERGSVFTFVLPGA